MPVEIICVICGAHFFVRPSRVPSAKYCSYACHQVGEGRKGGLVTGEQKKQASEGKAYTKTKGRHTHRVIAEKLLGRPLLAGEVVHHKDGNRLNNDPANIEVLSGQGEHVRRHHRQMMAARKAKGKTQ